MSDVLNGLKDELRAFELSAPSTHSLRGVCGGKKKEIHVEVVPASAQLALQVTARTSYTAGADATIPAGGILTVDLNGKASQEKVKTQTLVLDLEVAGESLGNERAQEPGPEDNRSGLPDLVKGRPIASTLWEIREQLLKVDHDKKPCLVPKKATFELEFQVTTSCEAGGKLGFLIGGAEAKASRSSQTVQRLTVVFDMRASTPVRN